MQGNINLINNAPMLLKVIRNTEVQVCNCPVMWITVQGTCLHTSNIVQLCCCVSNGIPSYIWNLMTRYKQRYLNKKSVPIQVLVKILQHRNQTFAYDVKTKQHKWTCSIWHVYSTCYWIMLQMAYSRTHILVMVLIVGGITES